MWKYVPSGMPQNAPLVLALHACSQQAADYVKAGWNALADKYKFYVVYPEQTTTNNALTCFNWAGNNTNVLTGDNDPANLTRGMGENQSMKQMVDKMKADYSIDGKRVFISAACRAAAAQTALMLATWPDVFAAGATFAGIPYWCTINKNQVTTCLNPGVTHTPQEWGDLVRKDFPSYTGPWPRIAIWQGDQGQRRQPEQPDRAHEAVDQRPRASRRRRRRATPWRRAWRATCTRRERRAGGRGAQGRQHGPRRARRSEERMRRRGAILQRRRRVQRGDRGCRLGADGRRRRRGDGGVGGGGGGGGGGGTRRRRRWRRRRLRRRGGGGNWITPGARHGRRHGGRAAAAPPSATRRWAAPCRSRS